MSHRKIMIGIKREFYLSIILNIFLSGREGCLFVDAFICRLVDV